MQTELNKSDRLTQGQHSVSPLYFIFQRVTYISLLVPEFSSISILLFLKNGQRPDIFEDKNLCLLSSKSSTRIFNDDIQENETFTFYHFISNLLLGISKQEETITEVESQIRDTTPVPLSSKTPS